MNDYDKWILRRQLIGHTLNGEIQGVSRDFQRFSDHLNGLPLEARQQALDAFLTGRDDRDQIILAVADTDPMGPPPEAAPARCFATLADIARIVSDQPWLWRGWLARGVLNVVSSEPGTGKTRFALDLARRLWFGLDWPDGQRNELPERTRTLWVQADQAFPEMLQAARDFGLPDEAVALGSSPDDPTASLDLDEPESLSALAVRVQAAEAALVVIDTVGMTTARNLYRPEEARAYFAPLLEQAGKLGVAFLGQTHLSKGGEALGRRIVEKARVVVMMTCPDPEGQPIRRRLQVSKTAVLKPPPLGITMGAVGNDYDHNPPMEPDPSSRKTTGPAPVKLEACMTWLRDRLTLDPARVKDIRNDAEKAGYAVGTLYQARDDLAVDEYLVDRRKWWKLPEPDAPKAPDPDRPF